MANSIKSIAKFIRRNPDKEDAVILAEFCAALETDQPFALGRLFNLCPKAFELVLGLIEEWKFDRHVATRRLQKYLAQDDD